MKTAKRVIFIIGKSGAGKTTLIEGKNQKITCTTRKPRKGEINNVDYHFLSKEEFKNTPMIESNEFGGEFYGTPLNILESEEDTVFVILDVNGVISVTNYIKDNYSDIETAVVLMNISKEQIISNLIRDGYSFEEAEKRFNRNDMEEDLKKLTKANISIDLEINDLKNSKEKFEAFLKN